MRKLLKFLKPYVVGVVAVVCVLIVQAYCDLTLPTYMSNIVDVGIQQNGIESAVPEQIRAQTLSDLELFMTDDEIERIKTGYWEGEDGIWTRKTYLDDEQMDALADAFSVPMAMLYQMENSDTQADSTQAVHSMDELRQALDMGLVTKDQLLQMRMRRHTQAGCRAV